MDFYIGFLIAASPWLLYVLLERGNPFWNLNHLNVAFKMYEGGSGWNYFPTAEEFGGWRDVIASNPRLFVSMWWATLQGLPARLFQFFPGLGLVIILGVVIWLVRLNSRKSVFFTTVLVYAVLLSMVWLRDRFLLLFIPLIASFMASAVSVVPVTALGRVPLRRVVATLLVIVVGIVAIRTVPLTFEAEPTEYKAAADWIATVASQDTKILAPKPHIAFFSGTRNMDFRGYNVQEAEETDLPQILADARPDFVVYDERYALLQFPMLERLLYPEQNPYPDLLTCVFVIDEPKSLVIYQYSR